MPETTEERPIGPAVLLASIVLGLSLMVSSSIATSTWTNIVAIAVLIALSIVTLYAAAGVFPSWLRFGKRSSAAPTSKASKTT